METTINNWGAKALVVMVCMALICLANATEGISSQIPEAKKAISIDLPFKPEHSNLPLFSSNKLETTETEPLLLVRSDSVPVMESPPGGSVWEIALENRHNQPGMTGGSTGNGNNNGNTGGQNNGGRTYGGRLVNPDCDVVWGDGTVTPEGIAKCPSNE